VCSSDLHMARHMDVNALCFWDIEQKRSLEIEHFALENMKRVHFEKNASTDDGLDLIMKFQEIKTTWHPIDRIESSGAGY